MVSFGLNNVYKTFPVLVGMQWNLDLADNRALLFARRLPARLNMEQTAVMLGFQPHDIPVLVKADVLKPLGGGPSNTVKYFAAESVERLARDEKQLDKATKALRRERNKKSDKPGNHSQGMAPESTAKAV